MFPDQTRAQLGEQEAVRQYLLSALCPLRWSARLVAKAMELYVAMASASAVSIIGPSGGGKSELRSGLLAALRHISGKTGERFQQAVMYPNAVSTGQLYGEMDANGDGTVGHIEVIVVVNS